VEKDRHFVRIFPGFSLAPTDELSVKQKTLEWLDAEKRHGILIFRFGSELCNLDRQFDDGFQVIRAVTVMSIFWILTSCVSTLGHRCLGGTYHLHLQDRTLSQATSHRQTASCFPPTGSNTFFLNVGRRYSL
jgi:hypothetical protein